MREKIKRRASAGKSSKRTARKPPNEIEALLAADAAWLAAYVARDVGRAAAFCDEHASMLMPNSPAVTGKAKIRALIAQHLAPKSAGITWRPNKAGVARSGDLGYTSGTYKMSFTDASGKTFRDNGKYVMVWKKSARGGWKVLYDISNSELPVSPSRRF